jgi:hypothetical protein
VSDRRTALLAVACGAVGAAVMVVIDSPYAIAAGVVLLVAFIALGAAAIATPAYLGRDGDEEDAEGR